MPARLLAPAAAAVCTPTKRESARRSSTQMDRNCMLRCEERENMGRRFGLVPARSVSNVFSACHVARMMRRDAKVAAKIWESDRREVCWAATPYAATTCKHGERDDALPRATVHALPQHARCGCARIRQLSELICHAAPRPRWWQPYPQWHSNVEAAEAAVGLQFQQQPLQREQCVPRARGDDPRTALGW